MKHLLLAILLTTGALHGANTLLDAVRQGDHQQLTTLLSRKVNVNLAEADGMTALHYAVFKDNTEAALMLLGAKADPVVKNAYGITPLWLACQNGNAKLVRALLEAGADAEDQQTGGQTVLMTASRSGSLDAVKALVGKGADVDARESRGQTAIMWASAEGHAEVAAWLIEQGADFRTPLRGGFTPLFFAIREGRFDVLKVLLAAGVDVNETMKPERRAGRGPQNGMTPLLMAVENGHFEMAIHLVKAGANPNDLGAGYAALHAISWVRKPDSGEGVNGQPPPDGSGNLTSLDFVRQIVALGANVNLPLARGSGGRGKFNQKGVTPFMMAAKTADLELLQLLHELGADPNIRTIDEVTPIIVAAGLGTEAAGEVAGTEEEVLETVGWLIDIGQDVNAVDVHGETAMHSAAYKNLPKVVEYLVERGADLNVWNQRNEYGWTPLLIAEGFRPGNFKPSFETIDAIHKVMLASGVTPPPLTPAKGVNNSDFGPANRKYDDKDLWKDKQ
jgi:ankyrin repeat protein